MKCGPHSSDRRAIVASTEDEISECQLVSKYLIRNRRRSDDKQLLLHREQRRKFDIAGVQLDLDDRLPDHLELDEPEISDGKGNGIVIGVGVAQRGEELRCTGQYPLTFGTDQNCEMLHDSPPAARRRAPSCERTAL